MTKPFTFDISPTHWTKQTHIFGPPFYSARHTKDVVHYWVEREVSRYTSFLREFEDAQQKVITSLSALNFGQNVSDKS